jgi:hypothetical protein
VLFHLLPDVEEQNLWASSFANGYYDGGKGGFEGVSGYASSGGICGARVKVYICPSDPTVNHFANDQNWEPGGLASYAGNFQVFGVPGSDGQTRATWQGSSRIPSSFGDGTSNTILFAEKMGICGSNGPGYGNLWDRWDNEDQFVPIFAAPPTPTRTGPESRSAAATASPRIPSRCAPSRLPTVTPHCRPPSTRTP